MKHFLTNPSHAIILSLLILTMSTSCVFIMTNSDCGHADMPSAQHFDTASEELIHLAKTINQQDESVQEAFYEAQGCLSYQDEGPEVDIPLKILQTVYPAITSEDLKGAVDVDVSEVATLGPIICVYLLILC